MTRVQPAGRPHRSTPPNHCNATARRAGRRRSSLGLRVGAFLTVVVAVVAAVFWLWPKAEAPSGSVGQTVQLSMGGFTPSVVTVRAGEPVRLQLVNGDSPYHTDGGGWHQFAAPDLGVDAKVAPRSRSEVEIPATAPGEYAFYCDVCCGGKENPSMQGILRVRA